MIIIKGMDPTLIIKGMDLTLVIKANYTDCWLDFSQERSTQLICLSDLLEKNIRRCHVVSSTTHLPHLKHLPHLTVYCTNKALDKVNQIDNLV